VVKRDVSVSEVERVQQELEPKEDLAPYAGQWVALRDGYVVASDIDPGRLREHPDVRDGDVLLPVSEPEGGYFL
jgi:hypothetical protein